MYVGQRMYREHMGMRLMCRRWCCPKIDCKLPVGPVRMIHERLAEVISI